MQIPNPQQKPSSPARAILPATRDQDESEGVSWGQWQVIDRAHGFHVSREASAGGRVEFLRNEVHAVKVFRSQASAVAACAQANFTAEAERLKREPLLAGSAS